MTIIVVLIAWLLVIIALYCYTSKKSVQIDIEKKKEILDNTVQEEYEKKEKKETKYKYKINRSVAIGHLKRNLIKIYLCNSPRKRKRMLKNIFEIIQKNVLPERTGRQYSRSNRRTKFNRTHKRVL